MKVLITGRFSHEKNTDGPLTYSRQLAAGIQQEYEVNSVEYFHDGGKYSLRQKLFGRDSIEDEVKYDREGIVPMIWGAVRRRPDIIHISQFERYAVIFVFLRYILGCKIIYTCHGIVACEDRKKRLPILYRYINRILEYVLLKSADSILAFSDVVKTLARDEYSIDLICSRVHPDISNTINATAERQTPSGKLRLLFLGNFESREKSAVELINSLGRNVEALEITLIGFSENSILQLTSEGSTIKKLNLLPHDEWLKLLLQTDIFVIPMRYETYSFSGLEAMSAGAVVIAEMTSGIAEIFNDNENGLVFNSCAANSFASAVARLNDDRKMLKRLADNARNTARCYNSEAFRKQHGSIYNNILKDRD